ncbi:MAG: hypothetical protein AB7W37_10755, partial [Syntrophobacteraceae bacterium]
MKRGFTGILTVMLLLFAAAVHAWALGAERLKNHPQAGAASQGYVEGRVLVKMKQGASLASVRSRLGAIASEVKTAGTGKYELKRFNTLA